MARARAGIVAAGLLIACGGGGAPDPVEPPAVTISITPAVATVARGSRTRFGAAVLGTSDKRVAWSADGGTIEPDGSWTAPLVAGAFHVTARSIVDSEKAATASATVSLDEIAISISPDQATLAAGQTCQFTAHVTGTYDTGVSWSVEDPAGGSRIDTKGWFISMSEGTFRVVATSYADPTKSAVALVTVTRDLIDHGGPVAPATRTFALWLGELAAFSPDARPALEKLLQGLDGSEYLAIADQYMRGARATTTFGGSLFDGSPPDGTAISGAACRALDAAGITPRWGDLVFVNTSNHPMGSVSFCASHWYTVCRGEKVLIALLPNVAGTYCETLDDVCALGYSGATQSLLLGAAHELMESITDPFTTAWHGGGFIEGREITDLCGYVTCTSLSTGTTILPNLYSNAAHGCVP